MIKSRAHRWKRIFYLWLTIPFWWAWTFYSNPIVVAANEQILFYNCKCCFVEWRQVSCPVSGRSETRQLIWRCRNRPPPARRNPGSGRRRSGRCRTSRSTIRTPQGPGSERSKKTSFVGFEPRSCLPSEEQKRLLAQPRVPWSYFLILWFKMLIIM